MSPFNRAAWDGEKPLVEHTPDRDAVGPRPAVGDYVLPKAGAAGDGILRPKGRGMVWQITEWRDPHTGEIDLLLQVADNNEGELIFDDIRLQDIADRVRCGRLDALALVVLAAREIAAERARTAQKVKDVLDLAWRIVRAPAPEVDAPSLLDDCPIHEDLAARMAASTSAHRERTHH